MWKNDHPARELILSNDFSSLENDRLIEYMILEIGSVAIM